MDLLVNHKPVRGVVEIAPQYSGAYQLKGAYAAGTAYVPNDLAHASNVIYRCKANTTGNAPPNDTYWTVVADEMPRFLSILTANAGRAEVRMLPGLWAFQTDAIDCGYPLGWPSKTLVSGPGAVVISSIAASGLGNDRGSWLWAVWDGAATSTVHPATVTPGAITVQVHHDIPKGSTIAIQNQQADVWQYQRFAVTNCHDDGGGLFTLTLDRPIEFGFVADDPVWVLTYHPQSIHVDATGMTFAGTGDCIAEIAMGDDCSFCNSRYIADFGFITQKYISIADVGSTHVRCTGHDLDCAGSPVGSFGITVEAAVDADISNNSVRNCGGTGVWAGSSSNVRGHGLQISGCKYGLGIIANQSTLGHAYKGQGYVFTGGRITGCLTAGVYIWDDARGTVLDGMSIERNTADGVNVTGTTELQIRNCSIQNNGAYGVFFTDATTTGVTIRGAKIKNNTTADVYRNSAGVDVQGTPVSFTLGFYNSGGTLKHAAFASSANGSLPLNVGTISGLSSSWSTTPLVKSDIGFTAGGGIDNATPSVFVLNSDAFSADSELKVSAAVTYNDSSKDLSCEAIVSNIDVNGVTRRRLAVKLWTRITGSPQTFNTTTIPSQLYIKIHGEMV
jgi:hypothetical protein